MMKAYQQADGSSERGPYMARPQSAQISDGLARPQSAQFSDHLIVGIEASNRPRLKSEKPKN
jgi:hypothetical protein